MESVRLISFLLVALALSSSIQRTFSHRKIPAGAISGPDLPIRRPSPASSGSDSCWNAIDAVENCKDEIYLSLKSNEIEVSYDCCKAILQKLPAKCAGVISSGEEFSPEFGSAVNEFCDGMGITPAPVEEKAEQR